MTRYFLSLRALVPAVVLFFSASCSTSDPAPTARPGPKTLRDYQDLAAASKDPMAVWIAALDTSDPDIVDRALREMNKGSDPRALEPLRRAARRWLPKETHDSEPLGSHATLIIERIEAVVAFDKEFPSSLTEDARFEKALAQAKVPQSNYIYWTLLIKELLLSSDERILPVLLLDTTSLTIDKIMSFGAKATPVLLETLTGSTNQRSRVNAAWYLGKMKIKEGLEPLVRSLNRIKVQEVLGPSSTQEQSQFYGTLIQCLELYGEAALEDLRVAALRAPPMGRRGLYTAIGGIGGPKALSILKTAGPTETSRDDSDGIDVLGVINVFVERIERGENK